MVKLDSTISPHENITAFIYMANCSGFGFKCEHPMHWSAYNIVASKSALLTSAMICDVKRSNNERKISGDFWNSVNSGACADSLYVPGPLLSFGRRGLGTRLVLDHVQSNRNRTFYFPTEVGVSSNSWSFLLAWSR